MEIVLLLLLLLAVVAGTATVLVARRGRGHVDLEPPPAPGVPPQAPPPEARDEAPPRPTRGEAPAADVPHPPAPPAAPPSAEPGPPPTEEPVAEERSGEPPAEEPPAEGPPAEEPLAQAPTAEEPATEEPVAESAARPSFRERLGKARGLLADYVGSVLSRSTVDEETWEEIEEALIRADVGVARTTELLDQLRQTAAAEGITEPAALLDALKAELKRELAKDDLALHFDEDTTNVWLVVGVNGTGKTTSIGKIAHQQQTAGRTVLLAAGDTFRAAAGEQLDIWAERVGTELVRGAEGADPGSVVFDAVERAHARGYDLVLADTAGRLHTKTNLMEELGKVRRVAEKGAGAVTEVLLVIDANTGQNGLVQARQFAEAVAVTGVVLTKLDSSARGGIVLAIQHELGIPVKLVGLGETVHDLVAFDPDEFVEALFVE